MAACSFSYPLQGDPQAAFDQARREIMRQGGTVTGTATRGTARVPSPVGAISMAYTVQGSQLAIDVTDKPWLASCGQIDTALGKAIAASRPVQPAPVVTPSGGKVVVTPSGGKVIELDTVYIEGDTGVRPAPPAQAKWLGLAAFAVGVAVVGSIVWWRKRRHAR